MPSRPRTRPDSADLADQTAFVGALTAPRTAVSGLHNGKGRPAADRFAVYRNNVAHSLTEALGTTFAATKTALGDAPFRALALAHVREEPPTSPVLFTYGATFPDRLADPALRDLARLEHARVQAFHAADAEPASLDALGAMGTSRAAGWGRSVSAGSASGGTAPSSSRLAGSASAAWKAWTRACSSRARSLRAGSASRSGKVAP